MSVHSLELQLDQKLELMSRTQDGRLTEQGNRMKLIPDIDFKLDGLGRKLGELGGQVQVGSVQFREII